MTWHRYFYLEGDSFSVQTLVQQQTQVFKNYLHNQGTGNTTHGSRKQTQQRKIECENCTTRIENYLREGRLVTGLSMRDCVTGFPTGSGAQGTGPTMPTHFISLPRESARFQNFKMEPIRLECFYWSFPDFFVSQ